MIKHLKKLLKPNGCLTLTTGCQDGSIVMEYLNLSCIMSKGLDALPHHQEVEDQLKKAGFIKVESIRLVPKKIDNIFAFIAKNNPT